MLVLLYIFWFLHQTTTLYITYLKWCPLYIFWFLHQTTTMLTSLLIFPSCISFDSYTKPQPSGDGNVFFRVVYLLIPTPNHNSIRLLSIRCTLYIFWFLHQTTTIFKPLASEGGCISFDSYTKPQRYCHRKLWVLRCISFDSYTKPQPDALLYLKATSCISFDSYIKPQLKYAQASTLSGCISFDSYIKPQLGVYRLHQLAVVYLLIPTSNHNSSYLI